MNSTCRRRLQGADRPSYGAGGVHSDLPGKTIASVLGSTAGDYLTQRGVPFVSVSYGPDAIRMLTDGEVQAVVFNAPTHQYWAAR